MPSDDYSLEDRWQAWCGAYVALCERLVDAAKGKPGQYGADSPATLRELVDRLRELGDIEPALPGLVITMPEFEHSKPCRECGAPNGGGYVTLNCPACRDADGSAMPWQTPGWST